MLGRLVLAAALLNPTGAVLASEAESDAVSRGAYLFAMAGCASCHTDSENAGQPLAGGLAMATPFGTFFTPNISSDPQHGIGAWSLDEFIRAMREGLSPEGEHYYPAFPYTAYSRISDAELRDLKTYLDSQPAVPVPSREHQLSFPFRYRSLLGVWKWLYLEEGQFEPDPKRSPEWNRGAYIVNGPGHCIECHSPRTALGGLDKDKTLAGNPDGPEGEKVPGLTAASNSEFAQWSLEDIQFALEAGMLPDGDFFSGSMGHVVENSTSQLTDADRQAIAEYLKALP